MTNSYPARVFRRDYYDRRKSVESTFGSDILSLVKKWYGDESLSAQEIVDRLKEKGIDYNVRSIQRIASDKLGIARSIGEAFRLAAQKGRVHWAYRDPKTKIVRKRMPTKVRFEILRRDNFQCVLCGATSSTTTLEVDHIIAVVRGGSNNPENLRTLCYLCNQGKRSVERECHVRPYMEK